MTPIPRRLQIGVCPKCGSVGTGGMDCYGPRDKRRGPRHEPVQMIYRTYALVDGDD
jgi:hypothetical protein